jgi:hypothetical protein
LRTFVAMPRLFWKSLFRLLVAPSRRVPQPLSGNVGHEKEEDDLSDLSGKTLSWLALGSGVLHFGGRP